MSVWPCFKTRINLVARVRGVTALQALLLADARRERRGTRTRWTTAARIYQRRTTRTATTMAEVNEVAAAEGGGSTRRGSSVYKNT